MFLNKEIMLSCVIISVILMNIYASLGQQINMSTTDCGVNWGCFAYPSNCSSGLDCEFIIKWRDAGYRNEFQIYRTLQNNTNIWMGLGLSLDQMMTNDSVTICAKNGTATFVEQYYTHARASPLILNPSNRSVGLSDQKMIVADNLAMCTFKREKSNNVSPYFYDLKNIYYLFSAIGVYTTRITRHYSRSYSQQRFNLSSKTATNTQSTSEDCGVGYGCYKIPSSCKEAKDCEFLIKWRNLGDRIKFTLSTQLPDLYNNWLAIGFSKDDKMTDDSVVMCKTTATGGFLIHTYYTDPYYLPDFLTRADKTYGLSDTQASVDQLLFTCSFTRLIQSPNNISNFFDLNYPFYLLVAKGETTSTDDPTYHGVNKIVSSSRILFTSTEVVQENSKTVFVKLHGVIMMISWNFLGTTGVLFSRYYRYFFRRKKFLGAKFWFIMHGPLMVSVCIATLTAFFMILVYKAWSWTTVGLSLNFFHSLMGIATISLAMFQTSALVRPNKDHPKRYVFSIIHRTVGCTAYVCSLCATSLGFLTFFSLKYWYMIATWVVWITIYTILLEIIDQNLKKYGGTKEELAVEKSKAKSLKTSLFGIHVCSSAVFVSILVVLIEYPL